MTEPWHNDERLLDAKVWYSHIKDEQGRLVRTVASIDDVDEDVVHMGVARRHPNDHSFSRKMGRAIAGGRARFAMAKSLGLTERLGRPSKFDTMATLPRLEYIKLARELGVEIPDEAVAEVEEFVVTA